MTIYTKSSLEKSEYNSIYNTIAQILIVYISKKMSSFKP